MMNKSYRLYAITIFMNMQLRRDIIYFAWIPSMVSWLLYYATMLISKLPANKLHVSVAFKQVCNDTCVVNSTLSSTTERICLRRLVLEPSVVYCDKITSRDSRLKFSYSFQNGDFVTSCFLYICRDDEDH